MCRSTRDTFSDIAATGAEIQHRSRWLNAASVLATPEQIARIAALPFVREVELTGRFRKRDTEPVPEEISLPAETLPKSNSTHALDYGASFNQVNQIKVPPLHDAGNAAQGVLVGVFDDGFRLPNHEAFATMNILATYDFVDNKVSVVPANSESNFRRPRRQYALHDWRIQTGRPDRAGIRSDIHSCPDGGHAQ